MAVRLPFLIEPPGLATLGGTAVAIAPVGSNGEVQIGGPDGPILRPLQFGERSRLVLYALSSSQAQETLCTLILQAAMVQPGSGDRRVQEVLALALAGAGQPEAPLFPAAALLVAHEAGWDPIQLSEATAAEVDQLAMYLGGTRPQTGWTKIMLAPSSPDELEVLRADLADDLLQRAELPPETSIQPEDFPIAGVPQIPGAYKSFAASGLEARSPFYAAPNSPSIAPWNTSPLPLQNRHADLPQGKNPISHPPSESPALSASTAPGLRSPDPPTPLAARSVQTQKLRSPASPAITARLPVPLPQTVSSLSEPSTLPEVGLPNTKLAGLSGTQLQTSAVISPRVHSGLSMRAIAAPTLGLPNSSAWNPRFTSEFEQSGDGLPSAASAGFSLAQPIPTLKAFIHGDSSPSKAVDSLAEALAIALHEEADLRGIDR